MSLCRFVLVPSVASEPWLGLLYEPVDGYSEQRIVTLWERVCRLDDAAIGPCHLPTEGTFGIETQNTKSRDIYAAAANARWAKHNERMKRNHDWREHIQKSAERRNIGVQCSLLGDAKVQKVQAKGLKESLGTALIEEATRNLARKAPRYSETFYKISALLYFSSAKTYRLIRQILWFPSISSLHRKYKEKLGSAAQKLICITRVSETIDSVRDFIKEQTSQGQKLNPTFTLGIDAFCFRSFSGCPIGTPVSEKLKTCVNMLSDKGDKRISVSERAVKYSHAFIFLLIPHDYRIPVKILHLAAAANGSYDSEITEKAKFIQQIASKAGLKIWCKSTDGDPGVNREHTEFYTNHIMGKSWNFHDLVTDIHKWLCHTKDAWVPIADPLHVFKNMRAKLLVHPIMLLPSCPPVCIEQMRNVLQLGNTLDDISQTGKMRDSYVMHLFTFENVIKLMRAGQTVAGYLLFPFACWIAVIFSESIDLPFRLFLVELSFQVFSSWLGYLPTLGMSGASCRAPVNGMTTFSDQQYASRILNTLAFFGVALTFGAENIRMDALGTHLVENSIGLARAASSDPRYERIIQTYARTEVKKEIAADLGVTLHVQGRVNHGGCKVDPDYQRGPKEASEVVSKPKEWRVDDLLNLLHGLCLPATRTGLVADMNQFLGELESVADALDKHEYQVNDAANSGIMARLIAFKKEKRED